MYYFDNASTTKVLKPAADAALKCMTENYGNPSSLHKMGVKAEEVLNSSRKLISNVFNCKDEEIIFTSCATESTNIAILGAANSKKRTGNKIVTTTIEHAATAQCINHLENKGFEIIKISPKNGKYYAEDIVNAIDDNTILISVIHVNNENGLILPIEEIAKQAKNKNPNILIHVDAVQSFCKIPINMNKVPVDLASVSGHKINTPKGIGALFMRKGVKIQRHSFGGLQENNIRPGTEALPSIAAFGVAAKINFENMNKSIEHYKLLKKHLLKRIKNNSEILLNSSDDCAPYIVNMSIKGIRSEIMLHFLEEKGFCVSSGSACSKSKKSGVLQNMGYSKKREDWAIRISFSTENTTNQIDMLIEAIESGQKSIIKTY